jgi:type I restriction enzyme R subunit
VPPPDPAGEDAALARALEAMRAELAKSQVDLDAVRAAVEDEAKRRLSAEERAAQLAEERALWESLAVDADAALAAVQAKHAAELAALQAAAVAAPPAAVDAVVALAAGAGERVELDEAATRRLIDAELRAAGWEVDSEALTEANGARPQKGLHRAIAEWRVAADGAKSASDRADYVLFVGLEAVAVVEAKRKKKDVSQSLEQAARYSRGFAPKGDAAPASGGPWGARAHRVPFLFATNGLPYLKQIAEKSGIWFRDARKDENHGRALEGWYSPEGLVALLKQDVSAANAKLAAEPTDYLDLRDYQVRAIRAVEAGVAEGKTSMLVAMATGTGKTRTAIGLVYRLLKTKRFRRVLFLVDRTALGEQTENAFKDILDELRRVRDALAKKYDDDIDELARALRAAQERSGRELVNLPPRELARVRPPRSS